MEVKKMKTTFNFTFKNFTKETIALALIPGLILTTGCSKKSSSAATSTSTTAASSISALPKSTGKVVSSGSSSLLKSDKLAREAEFYGRAATTGETFKKATGTDWGSTHSRAFCETTSMVKDLYTEAAEPDRILCYIGGMKKKEKFSADVEDGNYHFYKLLKDGTENLRVKFRVVKDGDLITTFEMFTCANFNGTGFEQESYLNQVNTSTESTIDTKHLMKMSSEDMDGDGTNDETNFGGKLNVKGNINSSKQWTSKIITGEKFTSFGSGSNKSTFGTSAKITQGIDTLTLEGYYGGNFNMSTFSMTFNNKFYSLAQLIGSDKVETFALGDGSSRFSVDFKIGGVASDSMNTTQSWTGDDRLPLATASEGTYYSQVNDKTLPTQDNPEVLTFGTTESWDCTSDAFKEATLDANVQSELDLCDGEFKGDSDSGGSKQIDCQNAI
jgi:hypothetical protein